MEVQTLSSILAGNLLAVDLEDLRFALHEADWILWYGEVTEDAPGLYRTSLTPVEQAPLRRLLGADALPETGSLYHCFLSHVRPGEQPPTWSVPPGNTPSEHRATFRLRDRQGHDRLVEDVLRLEPCGAGRWRAVGITRERVQTNVRQETIARLLTLARCRIWVADMVSRDDELRGSLRFSTDGPIDPDTLQDLEDWYARLGADDPLAARRAADDALRSGQTRYQQDLPCVDADGQRVWMHEIVRLDPLAPGRWLGIGVVFDITDHKRLQLLLAGQSRLLEMVATGVPLQRVLDELNREIESLIDGALTGVLGFDTQNHTLIDLSGPSLPDAYRAAIDGMVVGPETGSCGAAVFSKECVIAEDLAVHPYWSAFKGLVVDTHGLRACWSQPILSASGAVLGTFAVYHRQPYAPDAIQREILRVAAHLAGVAMDRDAQAQALARSEADIRQVLTGASCLLYHGLVTARPGGYDWDLTFVNLEAAQLVLPLEATTPEHYAHAFIAARLPEDAPLTDRNADEALRSGAPGFAQEFRCRDRDGGLRWLREEITLDQLEPGRWLAVGVCTDVTARRGAEEIQNRILDGARCLLWYADVVDDGSPHLHWTLRPIRIDALRQMIPLEDGDTAETYWEAFHRARVKEMGPLTAREAFLGGEPGYIQTYRVRDRDGNLHWLREEVTIQPGGPERWGAIGLITDITQVHQAERRLHRTLTSARCLLWDADVSFDSDGELDVDLRFANLDAAQQMLPLDADSHDTYRDAFVDSRHPDDLIASLQRLEDAIRAGQPNFSHEYRCTDRTGAVHGIREDVSVETIHPGRWHAVGVCVDITELKQAEWNLNQIVSSARCLLWCSTVTQVDSHLEWERVVPPFLGSSALASAQEFLQLPGDELRQYWEHFYNSILPQDQVRIGRIAERAIRSGNGTYSSEFRITDREGQMRWLREDASLQLQEPGHWLKIGVVTDITARKESEAFLDHTLIGARCVLWFANLRVDPAGYQWDFRLPNPEAARLFLGIAADESNELLAEMHRRIPAEDEAAMEDRYLQAIRTGSHSYSHVFRYFQSPDRERRLCEDVRLERAGPGHWRAIGVITDVTSAGQSDIEQRQVLEDLTASREQYHRLFINSPVGIYRAMPGGRLILANPALLNMIDPTLTDEMLNQHIYQVALEHPSYQQADFREALERDGEVHGWESDWRRADESSVSVRESARAVLGEDGAVLFYEGTVEDITARRAAEDRIQWQATHDALTQLPNRRLFTEQVDAALREARRSGGQVAVAFIDLDRFKQINDTLGHSAGDRLLVVVADRLRQAVRSTDGVFRMGGDEFTLLLTGHDPAAAVTRIGRAIRRALNAPIFLDGFECVLSGSIGVSLFPRDGDDAAALLRHADIAMYRVKQQGGDGFEFFLRRNEEPMLDRLRIESDLRRSISRGELALLYQPQICVRTGTVIALEALLRWNHPERGQIMPNDFIPVAEESGLILSIGEWVLRTACADAARWQARGADVRVAVNVSARQLSQRSLPRRVAAILQEHNLVPGTICLELTETAIMRNGKSAERTLAALKAQGVRLQLDDFGTGYSSLALLQRYAMDTLKIDRMFVEGVARGGKDAAVVRAVIELGRALGLEVIAEGVETLAQERALVALQCDALQGYLYHAPMPAEQIADLFGKTWLDRRRAA